VEISGENYEQLSDAVWIHNQVLHR